MISNRFNRLMVLGFIFAGWLNASQASQIEILSYNLENLFNADHDKDATGEDKQDYEFLPKAHPEKEAGCKKADPNFLRQCLNTDWTEEKIDWKIGNIKKVLDEHGSLPEILAVVEVENAEVLKRLADKLGYDGSVLTEGKDERGIDVGLMYRNTKNLKVVEEDGRIGKADTSSLSNPTRDILRVKFTLDGKPLSVYVNHWPSGRKSDDRMHVAAELKRFMAEEVAKDPSVFQIAVGDFNVIPTDKAIKKDAVEEVVKTNHAGEALDEVADLFWAYHKKNGDEEEVRETFPKGTFFYVTDWQWNTLDRFFVRKASASKSKISVVEDSYKIVSVPFNRTSLTGKQGKGAGKTAKDIPRKCFHGRTTPEALGVSDHFPLSVKLQTN